MELKNQSAWWKQYFGRSYGKLYRGLLNQELMTDQEVHLLKEFFLTVEKPVLDLGCAYGRHATALARSEVPTIGLDYSRDLLNACESTDHLSLLRGDMRFIPLRDNSLGGVYALFNSFGYFSDDENKRVLSEVYRVLEDNALFVMDLPVRSVMKDVVKEVPVVTKEGENVEIYESWKFDSSAKRLVSKGKWTIEDEVEEWELHLRMYTPKEIKRLLNKAGFQDSIRLFPLEEIDNILQDDEGFDLDDTIWKDATNMLVVARK